MSADLIIYAVVAAALIFWLRSILGTGGSDEKGRPTNPYASDGNIQSLDSILKDSKILDGEGGTLAHDKIIELAENPTDTLSIKDKAVEKGLIDISKADKSFDIKNFAEAAQDVFAMVVESFAEGDRETLSDLLATPVYTAFEDAIKQREDNEETQQSEIRAIRNLEFIESEIKGKMALITIRFSADEISVTKNKKGKVIAGHSQKITEMRDIWVFGREVKSRDPRWLVQETRGDFDGDNDLLPNTDS